MNKAPKPQISIKTLFLLMLLAALSLRLIMVDQRFRKLLAETSSLGSVGGEAAELRTKLGYLVPEDTNSLYTVPIPPITGNSRSFRLYLPRIEGKRLLKLGMTTGKTRYLLPQTNDKWPSVHQFELSDSEEQVITVAWLRSESGESIIRVERTGFAPENVQFQDAGFLESKDYDWPFISPLDVQATSVHSLGQSFILWEISAAKKSLSPEELGVVSGFRLWIEPTP